MQKTSYIWLNGEFIKWNEARTHLLAHTLHYGSGAFEGIRLYKNEEGSGIFKLKEHMDRFIFSTKKIAFKTSLNSEKLQKAAIETIKKSRLEEGYIRPLAYRGYGETRVTPSKSGINIMISAWKWKKPYLENESVRVKISPFTKPGRNSTIHEAKLCGNYINSILASREAQNSGFDEAVLKDEDGNIAEGASENIFMIKNKKIFTPAKGSILPGITRDTVIRLAEDLGYEVEESKITPAALKNCDEAFFTGTAAEITPIRQIDEFKTGKTPGPITEELQRSYFEITRGLNPKYEKWLTNISF